MSGTLPRVSVATALRQVCGVAALLALFAMHGLTVHGAMHAGHEIEPISATAVVAEHDHDAHGAAMTSAPDGSASTASKETTPDRDLLGFAGLCLAILLSGVVAVVFLSRFVRLQRRPKPASASGWPCRSRRDRDPPCLFALSIQRC